MQASDIIQPTVLSTPVAVDGIKNTIPTNPASSSTNLASITQGFPSITMQSVANGGLPPMGQDFNGLFYLATDQKVYLQNGGTITFNEDVSTAIGGYPNGAVLDYVDSNNNFLKVQSLIDNNTYNFVTTPSYIDGTHWQLLNNGGANIDLSNLSDTGNDYINQSKALTTGNVSSNSDVYADILKRAHSTFDLSKFEVVGSPTITDDGIASGFSSNNRVETITLDTSKKNYHVKLSGIECRGKQSFVFGNRNISKSQSLNLIFDVNKIALFVSSTGDSWDIANYPSSSFIFEVNKVYDISFIREGGNTYKVIVFDHSLNQEFTIITISSELDIYNSPNKICIGSGSWEAYSGSIDLKQFSITVDDIPVFNGNKTGLYVAKSDDYEVVGSPTITEDGILSDLSNSNYIKTNINLSSTYRIEIDLDILDTPSVSQFFIDIFRGTKHLKGYIGPSGNLVFFFQDGASNSYCGSVKPNFNQKNKILFELTQDQAITQCNDSSQTITRDSIPVELILTGECIFYIGKGEVIKSINLNSIKVYSDGNLIYQPCLKIPYTETFEHPKVVDVAYRDRVQDLYEQTGEALFYTIDEQNQNFTLPMGDIYGMITKNREILDIVYPIGRPMPEENNVLLDNEVWLEGATVNPIDYPKLFKVYGTKYGGDGTTTFKLPDLRNRVLWGSPDGSNGYIEAKLPNIKGSCGKFDVYESGAEGCFNINSQTYGNTREQWGGNVAAIGFNASGSSSIYSDDATTVQPPAFKVRWKTRFE